MGAILETIGLVSRPVLPPAIYLQFRERERGALEVEVRDHETRELLDVMRLREAAEWLEHLNYRPFLGAQAVYFREAPHG